MSETQQAWSFRISNQGEFVQLEGMRECPDFVPHNRTLRNATTIKDAQAGSTVKKKFNRQKEGAELSIKLDYLPGELTQEILTAAEGNNAGVDVQMEIVGELNIVTFEFNVLVQSRTIMLAAAGDTEAVDSVQYSLVVNSDVNENAVVNEDSEEL